MNTNQSSNESKLKILINIVVLIYALWGISRYEIKEQKTTLFDNVLIELMGPVQNSLSSTKESISYFFNHYLLIVGVSKANEELKSKIDALEAQLFEYEEIARENVRLKSLLRFGEDFKYSKVLAQVVGWDSSSDYKVIRINKGIKDGIRLRSPVVTSKGLVGYISRMTENYSDVLTILDQNNRVDSIIARTRTHGIVEGSTSSKCSMKYVARSEPVLVKDVVITAGLGAVYPKGIRVGVISKVEKESYGVTQVLEVSPAVDFGKIEEVVVLIGDRQEINEDQIDYEQLSQTFDDPQLPRLVESSNLTNVSSSTSTTSSLGQNFTSVSNASTSTKTQSQKTKVKPTLSNAETSKNATSTNINLSTGGSP